MHLKNSKALSAAQIDLTETRIRRLVFGHRLLSFEALKMIELYIADMDKYPNNTSIVVEANHMVGIETLPSIS